MNISRFFNMINDNKKNCGMKKRYEFITSQEFSASKEANEIQIKNTIINILFDFKTFFILFSFFNRTFNF